MARPVSVFFPAVDLFYFLDGGDGSAGLIPLKSTLIYPVILKNIARNISFTTLQDLSLNEITIEGLDEFTNPISETLQGPNNDTVFSRWQYSQINSFTIDDDYTDLNIGTGDIGRTHWIKLSTLSTIGFITIGTRATSTINYSIYGTNQMLESYRWTPSTIQYDFPAAPILLAQDPLETGVGSNIVTVTIPYNPTLKTGDIMRIQGATDVGAITAAELNIDASITVLDPTHFVYHATGAALSDLIGGGSNVSYIAPSPPWEELLLGNQTGDSFFSPTPYNLSAVQLRINSSSAGGSLITNVLQQGIT